MAIWHKDREHLIEGCRVKFVSQNRPLYLTGLWFPTITIESISQNKIIGKY